MRKFYFLSFLVLLSSIVFGQTTLVNSTFETGDPTVWTLANQASTNQWFIGSATASSGSRSAYVTTDGGLTNAYDIAVTTTSNHLYTPVTFPAGQTAIILQFDWRNIGEQNTTSWDFIRVSLSATAPVGGTVPNTADQLPVVFIGSANYVKGYVVIPASYAGTTRNLVFSWRNDDADGNVNPGPSIDNILLTSATPSPLSGTKTIQAGGSFTSLSEAIANLNAHGVGAGGVTFTIPTGAMLNETPPLITATGTASNPIIFQKSGAGANPLVTATYTGNFGPTSTGNPSGTGDAIIAISGGDYITFNGIDVASANYASNESIIEYGYKIINASATNGAQNCTIQNTSIRLNRANVQSVGIVQAATSTTYGGVTATSAAGANRNNKYYNVNIQNSYLGLILTAATTTAANADANNEIGTAAGGSTIIGAAYSGVPTGDIGGGTNSTVGIQATNQSSVKIFNTQVRNIAAGAIVRGIYLAGCFGTNNIYNNKVYGLRNTSTSSTSEVDGMDLDLASTGTHTINAYNNFISDITSAYSGVASSTRQLKGVILGSSASTSVYNFDHNSVRIDGSGSPTISSVVLEFGSATPINNVRNNILSNFTEAQTDIAKHYVFRSTSATSFGAASSVSNYNDLYIDNSSNGFVALANSTATGGDRANISDWTAAMTGNANTDINSISVLPSFSSTTDLHISTSSANVNGKGMPLPSITTDIDGDTRNASTPDLGADEYDVVAGVDVGISDLVAPISTGCYGTAQTIIVALKNFASSTHDFAANPVTVTVTVSGAGSLVTSTVVNTGTLAAGGILQVTLPATINMTAGGTYTFDANTSVTGDLSPGNNALTPAALRINDPIIGLPERVNFTGFTGTNLTTNFPNWREAKGESQPAGTVSNWLSSTLLTSGTSARINLDATADREWLVGPKFTATANSVLKFDVAITDDASSAADGDGGMAAGTDDQVIVRISTDCGVTYSDLFVFNASNTGGISNTFVPQSVSLSGYAGQDVIIAFYASEGTVNDAPDYDFHIDNIDIYNQSAIDAGAIGLVTPLVPPGSGCYTNAENVTVTVRNYGFAPLDFSATPLTVTTNVTGAVTTTLSATITTGSLAPDATLDVIMSSPLDMTTAGTYTFNASTSIAGDGDASNNAMQATTRFNAATVTLPEAVDFTGFTGSNLTTVFPNWTEASGETAPTGTTSNWTSSTSITGSGTSAKINLTSNTDREWLIGPKFTATSVSRLKFKVAITNASSATADPDGMTGTDDEVIVRISTNCGLTWSDLQVFNASNTPGIISNNLVEQTIPLDGFAGQTVIIAFYASEGTVNDAPDYDFHIDDINIESPPTVDFGAIGLVTPLTTPVTGCYTNAEDITVTIKNFGSTTIDFSVNPVTVTTNVTGAVTTTLTAVVASGTLAPDATLNVTMSAPLAMTAAGTYTFNATTSVTGDGNAANNAMTATARTNAPTVTLPQSVDFTGFTGSNLTTLFPNWTEASGATSPAGTTSTWTSSTAITGSGTTARINLAGTTDREWIVGPKFAATAASRLRFKVAITDASSANADPDGMANTDDEVIVKISSDCGLTWSDLHSFNSTNTPGIITNSLVDQSFSLSAYAGQTIIVAFFATEGTSDNTPSYDFHIDDINIENALPTDMSAVTLVSPVQKACFSNAEQVTIRVKNSGTATLDFAATPLTVNTNVTGAATTSLSGTVNTGTLAPDATLDVVMSAPLNMNSAGTYTFNASTTIAGDATPANDAMLSVNRTVTGLLPGTASSNMASVCVSGTPQLRLTGYNGETIQWQESTVGTSGPWTNVGTNSATYTPSAPVTSTMYYQAVVSCGSNSIPSNVVTVGYSNPSISGTTDATRCGTGPVTLSATASGTTVPNWYTAATGGSPVHTGNSYTIPSISTSATYYVAANGGPKTENFGRTGPNVPSSLSTGTRGLFFNATAPFVLNSVVVYPYSAGSGTIEVQSSSGATLTGPVSVSWPAGASGTTPHTINLNLSVPAGNDMFLVMTSMTGNITYEIAGNFNGTYPYTSPDGTVSITASRATSATPSTTTYYYFYDWTITTSCESSRTAVTATVNPVTTLAGTAGGPQVCDVQNVSDNMYTDNSCGMIAKVVPSGAAPVSGSVNSCVKIDATVQVFGSSPYVQRHFDIEPATNASTATATVTFYVLQSEFDAYNSNNGSFPDLPTGPSDNAGIANLRITQFGGTGTAPGNYTGSAKLIDPSDAAIVWNATNNWWEITIDVTGFSGFYIHTTLGTGPLPANLLTFSGSRQGSVNNLRWVVAQENDVLTYEVERSENGRNWNVVGSINSLGNTTSQRSYTFTDNNISGIKQLYRLRQLDVNGSSRLSNIISITGSKPSALALAGLFPNPAASKINVLVNAPSKDNITIAVMDAVGRVVKTQRNGIDAGSNTVEISLTGLSQGTYMVKITCDSNCEPAVSRFVKE